MASSWTWHWRAPGARGFYPALLRRLLAGRWIKVQLELVFSAAKFNWTQKVDGGCKRRLFSAETPSPIRGQKQRVVNSCGLVSTFSIFHMIGALVRNVLSARTVLLPPARLLLFSDQLDWLVTRSVTIGILI